MAATIKKTGAKKEIQFMKPICGMFIILLAPFLIKGQCPVINAAMVNGCAIPPSTSEGINEFVYFTTTSDATAGDYTLYYASNNPPSVPVGLFPIDTLAGINATTKNGTGTITTGGCPLIFVTSPATPIPANSNVILIPSNFDATYDLSNICNSGLYVILADISAFPSKSWSVSGNFANNTGGNPRYLQVANGANNCTSNVVTYNSSGWPSNGDGNAVWWGNSPPVYKNDGCALKAPLPTITPSPIAAVCEHNTSASLSFTTTGSPNQYNIDWDNAANAAGIADISTANLPASPLNIPLPPSAPAGTYTGSITVINNITSDTSLPQAISVTINAAPIVSVHPSTTVQNVCQFAAANQLSVTATAGSGSISGYQWYVNTSNNNTSGFAFPGATSPTYTPSTANIGTIYFYCKVTNSNGCTSTSNVSGALTVNPNIATPSATATQQPTCAAPTGTITVSAPAGANIQYSVDGTAGPYQPSGNFPGLAPGNTYDVAAKNVVTGCVSLVKSVVINPLPPGPAGLAASVTQQPTCAAPTGIITVSAPLGANYEYSVGGNYQSTLTFSGLTNGTTYNVTVKDVNSGCVSNPLPLAINTIAGAPAKPTISAVQTGCSTATGSITITSPLNSNYEYSIGGAYQPGVSFPGLTPGTNYQVTVKDVSTGCISAPLDTSMNAIPVLPTPGISIRAISYCQNEAAAVLNATVTVAGATLQWYANGSGANTTAPTPATTTPGIFKFYVSQKTGSCESNQDSITVTVNPTPAVPVTAGNNTLYCQNETENILTAAGNNLLWYTVATGGSGTNNPPTPSTAAPGNTNYYVSQTVNGCEGPRAVITITVKATPPAPAIANPIIQYCQHSTATALTANGTNLRWYNAPFGGTEYPSAPVPSTVNTGSTFYYVSQTVNGCESTRDIITVTVVAFPTPPIVATPVEYCLNQTATALTATGVNLQWYASLASTTALPAAPVPLTNTVSTTKFYVSQLINTCESKRDSITVIVKPASAPPVVISPLEFCQNTVANPLTATGANLLWYDAATGGTGSATAPTPQTATPATIFYYVTQNTNGCESTPRTAITVSVKVTTTAVSGFSYNPNIVCLNGLNPAPSYNLGFTMGGTFTSTPAGLSLDAATGNINLSASSQGDYNITYTYNTTGCVNGSTSSATITLNPPIPTEARFSYTSPVCKDAGVIIPQTFSSFTTGGTFIPTPPTGLSINTSTGEINAGSSTPGTYNIVYSIAEQGCRQARSSQASILIIDTASPVTKFNYSSTDVCMIAGAVNPNITKAAGFTAGGLFTATPAGLNINNTTGDINIGLSLPGTYVVKYSVPALGCRYAGSDSITFKLKAYGNPVTSFSYVGPVCKGDTKAIPVPDANFTEGGAFSSTAGLAIQAGSGVIDLNQSIAGGYTIMYTVPAGACNPAGSGSTSITILAQPEAPAVTSANVCGEGNIVLNASATGTISWYTEPQLINQINIGSSFATFIGSPVKYYVTNTVGTCESEPAIAEAIAYPIPAKPFIGNDTSVCANEKVILNAGIYNSYLWQDGSTNRTYTVNNPGIYKVIVSTGAGCSDSASINITILEDCFDLMFPNAFAPGGVNKTFGALGNLSPVSKYMLRIYNRYGQEIFATADPAKRWDGTFQGKGVNNGAYVYVATYVYKNKINRVKKGTVMVIR